MVDEASKTNLIRGPEFIQRYFSGKVIDIGCGPDKVTAEAEPFDFEDGDAEQILQYRDPESYDCVHSSHCLEHMSNPPDALSQWWRLVKPGGYLIVVVPDEDLYEQGRFPSIFNPDHKATFRLDKADSWSDKSHDVRALALGLQSAKIISLERHDRGYDYSLQRNGISQYNIVMAELNHVRKKVFRSLKLTDAELHRKANRLFFALGAPIDQTLDSAVAQIQVVIQKNI